MDNQLQPMETIAHVPRYSRGEQPEPLRNSVRAKLFVATFLTALAIGLVITFAQPTLYRASATVLMTAPVAIDDQEQEADVQSVAIQRRILLGGEVTRRLVQEMNNQDLTEVDSAFLRSTLSVDPVPDTNLVEMSATGSEKALLPALVDAWIDVYLDIRAIGIQDSHKQTMSLVRDQLAGLEVKLEEARLALAQYREEHDITSAERQENEVMARLEGLNEALNKAIEAEVQAAAKLQTMERAIAQGRKVVPVSERESVAAMEKELRQLRNQLKNLTKDYTLDYVRMQPRYRNIPVRINELEKTLDEVYSEGESLQLTLTQQEFEAAQQTVQELQQQLDAHEKDAARFTNIYATHQALSEDLARLEELNRDTQARLIEVQVNPVDKYPQVSVIDRPGNQAERLGPNYLVWLAGSCAGALALGVLSVWLYGFLSPRKEEPAFVTLSGVHMYPQEVSGQIDYSNAPPHKIPAGNSKLLEQGGSSEGDLPDGDANSGGKPEGKDSD